MHQRRPQTPPFDATARDDAGAELTATQKGRNGRKRYKMCAPRDVKTTLVCHKCRAYIRHTQSTLLNMCMTGHAWPHTHTCNYTPPPPHTHTSVLVNILKKNSVINSWRGFVWLFFIDRNSSYVILVFYKLNKTHRNQWVQMEHRIRSNCLKLHFIYIIFFFPQNGIQNWSRIKKIMFKKAVDIFILKNSLFLVTVQLNFDVTAM